MKKRKEDQREEGKEGRGAERARERDQSGQNKTIMSIQNANWDSEKLNHSCIIGTATLENNLANKSYKRKHAVTI